jgi:hypothetical protein
MTPFGGGMGGGLPLGDLGGGIGSLLHDSGDSGGHDKPSTDALKDPESASDPGNTNTRAPKGHELTDSAETAHDQSSQPAGTGGATQPAAAAGPGQINPADVAGPEPAGTTTSVNLPDGETRAAPNPAVANAVRAVMAGDNVNDAYAKYDLALSPPGTPVTAGAISPSKLEFGDTGQFTDHRVVALGGGKVWNNGQVIAVHDLETGPNFLGWEHTPQPAPHAPPAATTTGTALLPATSLQTQQNHRQP